MTTPKPISQLLSALGDTPEAVARTLEAKGIKGSRKNPHSCPIARYLRAEGWCVGVFQTIGYAKVPGSQGDMQSFPLPTPVTAFIEQFDSGLYPTLWA